MRGALAVLVLVPSLAMAQTASKPAPPPVAIAAPPPPVITVPSPVYNAFPVRPIACAQGCMSPAEAIALIGKVGPKAGVSGEFDFRVAGVGEDGGSIFLNSMADYRSPDCVTIRMPATVARQITGSLTLEAAKAYFMGTRVVVGGSARAVQINLTENGKPTGKSYFQNHIVVGNPAQLIIIEK